MEWNCRVSLSFKKVSASSYKRCPLTGGYNCRVLMEKLGGPQFGVRFGKCPLIGGVRKRRFNSTYLKGIECEDISRKDSLVTSSIFCVSNEKLNGTPPYISKPLWQFMFG